MLNLSPSRPPNDPYAPLRVFADMAKAFADPAAFQERMEKLIAQETAANAASKQAHENTAAAANLKETTAAELAEQRRQHDNQISQELAEHRRSMIAEREQIAAEKNATLELKDRAAKDAAQAAAALAEYQRRLRAMEGH